MRHQGLYLPGGPNINPDEKIQATIRRVFMAKDEDDKEAKEAMKRLTEMASKTPEVLAPQIIYYSLHVKDEREGWGILGMMAHFGTNWGPEIRRSIIPFLETDDNNLLREVTIWLSNIDGEFIEARVESTMLYYRETLKAKKEAPPPGLVNYVYSTNPSQALLLFDDIYWKQPWPHNLKWSDHIINIVKWRIRNRYLQEGDLEKAQKELDGLSKHEGWYARRYVVEVLSASPKLGTADIVNRLKKDPNPLVAEPAKLLK